MSMACGMNGTEVNTQFRWEILNKKYHYEDVGVNGKILLKGSLRK
jgi:hypothetical protein